MVKFLASHAASRALDQMISMWNVLFHQLVCGHIGNMFGHIEILVDLIDFIWSYRFLFGLIDILFSLIEFLMWSYQNSVSSL